MERGASGAIRRRWMKRFSPRSASPTIRSEQAEIAASLMGLPLESVQAEVRKLGRASARVASTRVIAGEQGAQRSVVVERRVVRKFGNDKRTGT